MGRLRSVGCGFRVGPNVVNLGDAGGQTKDFSSQAPRNDRKYHHVISSEARNPGVELFKFNGLRSGIEITI